MANPQKDKGKRFERDVAKFLTELFDKPFMRVQNSGAFTGGKNQVRTQAMSHTQIKGQRGDIIAPDEYEWVIECKNHKDFSTGFAGIIAGENKKLNGWLDEVIKDSNNGAIPHALAFKITGQTANIYFALPETHFKLLIDGNHAKYCYKGTRYTILTHTEMAKIKPQLEIHLDPKLNIH